MMKTSDIVLNLKANKRYMCPERLIQMKEEIDGELERRYAEKQGLESQEQKKATEQEKLVNEQKYGLKGVDW